MREILTLVSGLAWTLVYLTCIRRGFAGRTYCMPSAALSLNFSWECVYAVHGLTQPLDTQTVVDVVWAVFDAVILVTFVRFGRSELPAWLTRAQFLGWAVVLLALGFTLQLLLIEEFGTHAATRYSAFLMNVLMSALFVSFYVGRDGARGQSQVIAVGKLVGTLAATGVFGLLEHSGFITGLGVLCAVLDLVYVGLLAGDRDRTAPRRVGAHALG